MAVNVPKGKKKKWSKGKTKEKVNHTPIMDKETYAKMIKEVPTYKLITTAVLVDRLKVNGACARKALIDLEAQGLIKKVSHHASLQIYTRATAAVAVEVKA